MTYICRKTLELFDFIGWLLIGSPVGSACSCHGTRRLA